MAILTIDDILNHEFPKVKFKEGFDQEAVDAFLDRVIESMVLLQEENSKLKTQLDTTKRRLAEAEEQLSKSGNSLSEVEEPASELNTPSAPATPAPPAPEPVIDQSALSEQSEEEPKSVTSMLALAQRLHDDYVREGHEESENILAQAREEASAVLRKAEDQRYRVITELEKEQRELNQQIDELKKFERRYRSQIRSHLEGLLGDLEQGPLE